MSMTLLKYTYQFLTENKTQKEIDAHEGCKYTLWATTNVLEKYQELMIYFSKCNHPEDFIVWEKETDRAVRLVDLIDFRTNTPIISWIHKKVEKEILADRIGKNGGEREAKHAKENNDK